MRHRIKAPWPKEEVRILSNRFGVMKSTAAKSRHRFYWGSLQEFIDFLVGVAPEDYAPSKYRTTFDLQMLGPDGERLGYHPESLQLSRIESAIALKTAHRNTEQERIFAVIAALSSGQEVDILSLARRVAKNPKEVLAEFG